MQHLHQHLDQQPPGTNVDEHRFILDEMVRYPVYDGETMFAHSDAAGNMGLMRLGYPQTQESLGMPAHVTVQQVLGFPAGQGTGKTLILAAINHAQEAGCHGVLSASHNVGTEGFYERLGFVQEGPHWLLYPWTRPDLWAQSASGSWSSAG